jgi:hypothetical protein
LWLYNGYDRLYSSTFWENKSSTWLIKKKEEDDYRIILTKLFSNGKKAGNFSLQIIVDVCSLTAYHSKSWPPDLLSTAWTVMWSHKNCAAWTSQSWMWVACAFTPVYFSVYSHVCPNGHLPLTIICVMRPLCFCPAAAHSLVKQSVLNGHLSHTATNFWVPCVTV